MNSKPRVDQDRRRKRALLAFQILIYGYLITMFNKSIGVHVSYEADLRQVYDADVFTAVVPLAKDFKEAVIMRLTDILMAFPFIPIQTQSSSHIVRRRHSTHSKLQRGASRCESRARRGRAIRDRFRRAR